MRKLLFYSILLLWLPLQSWGQSPKEEAVPEFIKLMRERANVNDVKRAYESYEKAHGKREKRNGRKEESEEEHDGYMQVMRWLYWNEPRTYPSGDFPDLDLTLKESKRIASRMTAANATSNWTELGPRVWDDVSGHWAPGLGRVNVVAGLANYPNTVYIGSPGGGLWRTTNAGGSWTALTDNIPSMGVSAIAIHPTNPNTLLIGTGDRDASDTYGVGVLKSTDGGATWNPTSISWPVSARHSSTRLVVNPSTPNTVFAGTTDGLYRSTNFGDTWTRVLTGDIDDLELHPTNPSYVYALVGRTLYRSTDGGLTFTSTGKTSSRRAQIAVTPAAPDNVYYISKDGFYLSTNKGVSFTYRGTAPYPGNQDWYDLAIAVSPTDANRIHVGEVETFISTNLGSTWTQLSNWYYPDVAAGRYVHCDVHEITYIGNTLYHGSDGLVTKSTDGVNFTDMSTGLGTHQFYNIGISQTDANKFGGGAQDNGTYINTPGRGWHGWLGADGFEFVIAPDNVTVYGTSQNGSFYKSTTGGTNFATITQPGAGAWNTPFVMHPTDPNTLFVGNAAGVRKTTNGMSSWTTIGTFNPGPINDLAIAKSNSNYLYASVKERLWVTKNGGSTWTEITSGLPGYYIQDIAVDPLNAERVVVTCSGFNSGQKVFRSTNGGAGWTNISYNLPNLSANAAVFHKSTGLYVGMDVGIYYLPEGATAWETFMTGLPNVPITELEIQSQAGKLRAATYGRGIWESPLATSVGTLTYCTSKGNNVSEEFIGRVKVGTIDNSSGSNGGYADYTALSTNLSKGTAYPITVTPTWTGTVYKEAYAVWIDYNKNGVFIDAGEQVWSAAASTTTPASGTFTVPSAATVGSTRMRLSMKYNGIPTSCETFSYGEVEDYTVNIQNQVTCTNTTLSLVLDNYPAETSWSLKNSSGTVIASGGSYTSDQRGTTIISNNCLVNGCYTFVINDSYGDGICCAYGNGSYTIKDASGTVLASGGAFGSSETKTFCIGTGSAEAAMAEASKSSTSTGEAPELTLYPNPAKEFIHVTVSNATIKAIHVLSVDGRVDDAVTIQGNEVSLTNLPPGVYVIKVETDRGPATKYFIRDK